MSIRSIAALFKTAKLNFGRKLFQLPFVLGKGFCIINNNIRICFFMFFLLITKYPKLIHYLLYSLLTTFDFRNFNGLRIVIYAFNNLLLCIVC